MMWKLLKIGLPLIGLGVVIALMVLAAQGVSMPVVDTKGPVGDAQKDLLIQAVLIMLIVVVPVFILTLVFAIRYREGNKKAAYNPDWSSNKKLELIWWGIPIAIVGVLSVIAWQTSHQLDPSRPLDSVREPLRIQVVALQWKWLFIYPEQQVGSIGELAMPVDRPVEFIITSDAPMNSFWIPQLGGQIYAMSGMSTKLHLQADKVGDYKGTSANLSGEGHASMTFTAKALEEQAFTKWVNRAKKSNMILDAGEYERLRLPSLREDVGYFRDVPRNLYQTIVARYNGSHSMEQTKPKLETGSH